MPDDLAVLEAGLEKKEEPAAKRAKLKPYDLLPSQVLNAMGESGIQTTSLKQLADVQARGNKAAAYFTELYDDSRPRRGIAISRLAEVHLRTVEKSSQNKSGRVSVESYRDWCRENLGGDGAVGEPDDLAGS